MQSVTDIRFGSDPDLIGLHAFSKPVYFGLHPEWAKNPAKHYIFTLDYKLVKSSESTGEVSDERMASLQKSLGV